jgi:GNAT superfamily N-acetyltransferase
VIDQTAATANHLTVKDLDDQYSPKVDIFRDFVPRNMTEVVFMKNLQFRSAKTEDAQLLGKIAYDAFYSISTAHNFPPDFPSPEVGIGLLQMLVSRPDVYSVVAENGKLVGSNFLWEGDEVDGVGPITIDPAEQNSSVGRKLMENVIRRSDENGKRSIRLVQAAYHNRSLALYTKLGFDTVEPLSGISGNPVTVSVPGRKVREMSHEDLTEADELSKTVHGHSRRNEIASSLLTGLAKVVETDGRISGYFTQLGLFGHAVAETNEDLIALIGSGSEIQGPGFLLPTRNGEVMRWCLEHRLKIVQPMTLMSRGFYQEPRGAFIPSILY